MMYSVICMCVYLGQKYAFCLSACHAPCSVCSFVDCMSKKCLLNGKEEHVYSHSLPPARNIK